MPDAKSRYTFQTLTAANVDALAEDLSALHLAVRGEKRSPLWWSWVVAENPAGPGATAVAFRGGRMAGMISGAYARVRRGDETVRATLVGDFSVLPSERSWRCYTGLIDQSAKQAVADGSAFGYGFVVPAQRDLNRRLGAADLGEVPVWTGFLSLPRALRGRGWPVAAAALSAPAGWALRARRRTASAAFSIRAMESFGEETDDLWADVAVRRRVGVVRDAAYMQWRYVRCPDRRHLRMGLFRGDTLWGLAVLRLKPARRTACLLEMMAREDDPEALDALAGAVIARLDNEGIGLVSASFADGSAEAAALRRANFHRWTTRLWGLRFVVLSDPNRPDSTERDIRHWRFSMGDWTTQ